MIDSLKLIFASFVANILSFLFPIQNDLFGLVILFALNFLVGLLADLCNHREWSFRKAFYLFRDTTIYFVMITSIYSLGHLKNEEVTAIQCVSFLTYVAIYFYGTNILRNARILTQEQGTLFIILDFLYYMFSLRVVEKSTLLKRYLKSYEDNKNRL